MVVELFGMPRTVYELEVLKYSEYSEGSEGHSELGKSASGWGVHFSHFLVIPRQYVTQTS